MSDGSFVPRLVNTDGSRNVFCRQCRRLVGSTSSGQAGFGSCICAICDAANNGTELSAEIQDALTGNVRLSSGFMVPQNVVLSVEKDFPQDPMFHTKEEQEGPRGFMSYWIRVLKASVFAAADVLREGVERKIPLSKIVAKERKRSRVFALEDTVPDTREHKDKLRNE